MDEGAARCTMHAVVVLCFGCWQGLANRSMRIQDLYVGPVPIPRFIKEYSYLLLGMYVVWFSILILVSDNTVVMASQEPSGLPLHCAPAAEPLAGRRQTARRSTMQLADGAYS